MTRKNQPGIANAANNAASAKAARAAAKLQPNAKKNFRRLTKQDRERARSMLEILDRGDVDEPGVYAARIAVHFGVNAHDLRILLEKWGKI